VRVLLVVASLATFFLGAEAALWASGVSTLAETRDPFLGFSRRVRVFEPGPQQRLLRTSAGAAHAFNAQSFLAEKPEEAFRFFVLGGSSAYGFPWGADVAFPRILGDALRGTEPRRRIEAINAAGMSYASHRLRILVHEVLEYEPDLLIVYSGHNEFVERDFYRNLLERPRALDAIRHLLAQTRLYSAMTRLYLDLLELGSGEDPRPGAGRPTLGFAVDREPMVQVSPQEREQVRAQFEENLRAIVEAASKDEVPVILCTVPSNVRDWRPQQASFSPQTPRKDREAVRRMFAAARSALEAGDARAALRELESARELAPRHAGVHFQLGRAYEALERWEEARTSYVRARDVDDRPERAPTGLNATIRRMARETDALLVDIERLFEQTAEHGLLGFNLFEDYVHPTPRAHRLIALALWKRILEGGLMGSPRPAGEHAFWAAVGGGGPAQPGEGSPRADDDPIRTANLLFNQAAVLAHQGQDERALEKYREAVELAPRYWGAWLNIGLLEARHGRHEVAVQAYRKALAHQPDHERTLGLLGLSLYQLGRLEEARRTLERAVEVDPASAPAWHRLGYLRLMQRENAAAEAALRKSLSLDPSVADIHWLLGVALERQGRPADAVGSLERALELDPDHAKARRRLALLYRKQGRETDAAELERARRSPSASAGPR